MVGVISTGASNRRLQGPSYLDQHIRAGGTPAPPRPRFGAGVWPQWPEARPAQGPQKV